MAANTLGRNIAFKIYNSDGTEFEGLVLTKATFETVVMSLGDKISGDVYYKDNALVVTMSEYITYNGVKYMLVNPPTIVREGMAADNGEMRGMTKYSFTFYHPMCLLSNFPFSDVAVTSAQTKYLSQNKTFNWIGNLTDYVAKLNKNLDGTEWVVEIGDTVTSDIYNKLSDVMSFDKVTIADALKTGYETWEVPYVIDVIASTDARYALGKRFLIRFGLPSQEILDTNNNPFVFQFGKGVGLKNNSRTPRNNKIVTRIAGYGSENNVPYGYPQIVWTGNQDWDYTINNDSTAANSYPIYDGIVNGQRVRLIKHPFTRTHLMPSVYSDTVNKKVNPNATGYDPTIEIKDYYDAISSQEYTYPNPINPLAPSYEIHEFEDIKPELGQASVVGISAYDLEHADAISIEDCQEILLGFYSESHNETEKIQLNRLIFNLPTATELSGHSDAESYHYDWSLKSDEYYAYIKYTSSILNFTYIVLRAAQAPEPVWDDTMDDDGNYKQSYFKITLPTLSFDLYACAAITEEMQVNMRSGACIGCTFPIMVDWDDYKRNFYDADGNFDPVIGEGHPRNGDKYPDSSSGQITVVVQKDNQTFGVLMPNIYQKPTSGDQFVILGISLPLSYVTAAETRLDDAMIDYMRSNNVYYFDYPLKFDEHFLATHTNILSQMKTNTIVRFKYAGETLALYIKQMAVKFGVAPLPQYDITLTDDVEVVLNPVNKVADEVSRLSVVLNQGQSVDLEMLYAKFDERYDQRYISKVNDDTAAGLVRLIRGLQVGERFVTGLLGEGGVFREESDGTTYLECDKLYVRMKAYFDTVEIRKFLHSGGNRIASLAGIKCSRVEYIDANGDVTDDATDAVKFRCYFRADDNGETVTNDFVVGDLAFCKETNAQVGSGVEQHGYWRAVVGKNSTLTNDGEGWIDLSASDCLTGSDIPIAQDDIIQLGNKNDTTRQGAIVEYVGGADAPSYQIYQGINTYSLENKNYVSMGYNSSTARAYLNVYGDFRFGSKTDSGSYISYGSQTGVLNVKAVINAQSTIGNQSIPDYIRANQNNYDDSWIEPALQDIQDQIDGELDTWYYQGVPTLNNLPASTWTTDDEKKKHIGDLYYDKDTGYVYRFLYDDENETYYWTQIHDDAISEALRIANDAQDTADNKRRVFLQQPVPPYDAGDLWVNANYTDPSTQQVVYSNDILKCITGKTDGQSFSINDWTKASKYTDDSKLLTFLDGYQGTLTQVQDQIDKKAETWRQATDPSLASGWVAADHVGDIWMDTSANGGKKTYIYQRTNNTEPYTYGWVAQDVPDEVFDEIDGKVAIYVTWEAWMDGTTNNLQVRDLFIPSADTPPYKANKVYRCTNASTPTFQEINYTDDTALRTFLDGYQGTLTTIRNQIDKKAETWYQNSDPSTAWTTALLQAEHVGDLWYCTADITGTNYKKDTTWCYVDKGSGASPRYVWEQQNVPQEVFDKIDGKADIFVEKPTKYNENDMWIIESTLSDVDMPTGVVRGDIVIATQSSTSYNKAHWAKKDRYTDDTTVNAIIERYGQVLNIQTPSANSIGEALGYLEKVLSTGSTSIDGGLVLTNIIYMKDTSSTPSVWAGISGLRKSTETGTGYRGYGTAAWYGGGVSNAVPIDHEVSPTIANYAKTLFRFDGSGYLAGGNITWNAAGAVTIKNITTLSDSQNTNLLNELATFNNAFTFTTSGQGSTTVLSITPQVPFTTLSILESNVAHPVATQYWVNNNVSGNFWGKSWTNGASISGTLASVLHIQMTGHLYMHYNNAGIYLNSDGTGIDWHDASNAYVATLLAFSSSLITCQQQLYIPASKSLRIGGGLLVWDADNNAIKVLSSDGTSAANFYATGSVSALGSSGSGGGGGGSSTLAGLTDVELSNPSANQVLTYSNGKWVNANAQSGGTDMATVWNNLAGATNEQINKTHLTTALSGYATTSQLAGYLPLTGGQLNSGSNGDTLKLYSSAAYTAIVWQNAAASATAWATGIDTSTNNFYFWNSYLNAHAVDISRAGVISAKGLTITTNEENTAWFNNAATNATNNYAYFKVGGTNKGSVGYYRGLAFVANETTYARIGIEDDGTPEYWPSSTGTTKYTLLHTGNAASYNIGSATKLQTARSLWGNSFDGTADISGNIRILSTGSNYVEGIRIHPSTNNWCGVVLCGTDNTGASGTSAKTWGILNQDGTLWINKNGSNTHTGCELCNYNGKWGVGTITPSYLLTVAGTVGVTDMLTAAGGVTIGSAVLSWDSTNTWLNISNNVELSAGKYLLAGTRALGQTTAGNYLSAGGGYGKNAGRYGLKVLACDQTDCQTGLGQDLDPNIANGYDLCIVGSNRPSYDYGYISFVSHQADDNTYRALANFEDNAGVVKFIVRGDILTNKGKVTINSGSVGEGLSIISETTYSCVYYQIPSGNGTTYWSAGADANGFYFYHGVLYARIGNTGQLTLGAPQGTAPFSLSSTTLNTNLNADLLDGQHGSYYAAASSLSNYLPLSGGTLTNTNNVLNIASTNANAYILFKPTINGTQVNKATVGYYAGAAFIANESTYARLVVEDNGTPEYWPNANGTTKYTLIHAGNIGSQSVASAATLTTARSLWGNSFNGSADINSHIAISGTFNYGDYACEITNNSTGIYAASFTCIFPNCTTSNWVGGLTVGQAKNNNNAFTINFGYRGNASTSNFIGIGFWGNDNILTIKADKTASFSSTVSATGFLGNATTATTLQTARSLWGNSFNGSADLSGSLHIFSTGSGWNEGIRMHIAADGWCGLVMCGSDNTGASGTSAKTWGIHNNDGTFWINRNHSNGHTGVEICCGTANNWGVGTVSPQYKLHVGGTFGCDNTATFGSNIVSGNSGGAIEGFHSWELNTHNTAGTNIGGFLDFHYNGTSYDYSTRIVEDEANILSIIGKSATNGNNTRACLRVGANYSGTSYDGSYVQIGAIRIVYNSDTNALRVVKADGNAANFYATGSVSSLGYSDAAGNIGTFNTNILAYYTGTYDIGSSGSGKFRNLYLCGASDGSKGFSIITNYSGYAYIGSTQKIHFGCNVEFDDWIHVENRIEIGGDNSNYDLYVSGENGGDAYFLGNVSVASLTNRSDMRLKDVVGDVNLSIQQIASAPTFKFRFKNNGKRIMVGTSAQYWDAVLPESVTRDADGILGLDYGVTALVSTIILAKGMTEHERRIAKLEAENKELRARILDLEEKAA